MVVKYKVSVKVHLRTEEYGPTRRTRHLNIQDPAGFILRVKGNVWEMMHRMCRNIQLENNAAMALDIWSWWWLNINNNILYCYSK